MTIVPETVYELPPVHELSPEEAVEYFDGVARHYLGISGDEFVARWDAGEYDGVDDEFVIPVAILLPFKRK